MLLFFWSSLFRRMLEIAFNVVSFVLLLAFLAVIAWLGWAAYLHYSQPSIKPPEVQKVKQQRRMQTPSAKKDRSGEMGDQ
jgi:hypothetical protein